MRRSSRNRQPPEFSGKQLVGAHLMSEMHSSESVNRVVRRNGIRSLMDDFALYGASVHLTACFPVTLRSDEEKILQPRDRSPRGRREFKSSDSPTANHGTISPRLERNTNQATPAGPAAAFADNSLRELNDVKSPRIGRSNRWNWLTLSWEFVVTLWIYGRREREIRRAVAALAELDDRTLRDIGIPHRSHIEQVVRYCHDC